MNKKTKPLRTNPQQTESRLTIEPEPVLITADTVGDFRDREERLQDLFNLAAVLWAEMIRSTDWKMHERLPRKISGFPVSLLAEVKDSALAITQGGLTTSDLLEAADEIRKNALPPSSIVMSEECYADMTGMSVEEVRELLSREEGDDDDG